MDANMTASKDTARYSAIVDRYGNNFQFKYNKDKTAAMLWVRDKKISCIEGLILGNSDELVTYHDTNCRIGLRIEGRLYEINDNEKMQIIKILRKQGDVEAKATVEEDIDSLIAAEKALYDANFILPIRRKSTESRKPTDTSRKPSNGKR